MQERKLGGQLPLSSEEEEEEEEEERWLRRGEDDEDEVFRSRCGEENGRSGGSGGGCKADIGVVRSATRRSGGSNIFLR